MQRNMQKCTILLQCERFYLKSLTQAATIYSGNQTLIQIRTRVLQFQVGKQTEGYNNRRHDSIKHLCAISSQLSSPLPPPVITKTKFFVLGSTFGVQTHRLMWTAEWATAFPYPCKYLISATVWPACSAKSVGHLKLQTSTTICMLSILDQSFVLFRLFNQTKVR